MWRSRVSAQNVIVFFVYKENTFASATIEIAPDQHVISTGLYAVVRHPMYVGGVFWFVGMSLALGSGWGFFVFALIFPALLWRILDEERLLTKNLQGYAAYCQKMRYRLVPFVW
jgi:protein-S-isoprenylcysteine O-methyltransferase Ste14